MHPKSWKKLIISIILCQFAGIIGSFFTVSNIPTWYESLNKPSFNPPNWIFSPVWITLFILVGIALYLLWIKKAKSAIKIFSFQLVLNAVWSILFFGLKNPLAAFIEIILLWIAILSTIISSYKVSKPAAYLLIPYILWVSFAAILNLAIILLN